MVFDFVGGRRRIGRNIHIGQINRQLTQTTAPGEERDSTLCVNF
jgi:hypothetical protein